MRISGELSNSSYLKPNPALSPFISRIELIRHELLGADRGNFMLVLNHPSMVDIFVVESIAKMVGTKINFTCHGNFLKVPFLRKLLKERGYIGVTPMRSPEYYMEKYACSIEEARERAKLRIKDALHVNLGGIREAQRRLATGDNIGIFITGGGYAPITEPIGEGFRVIARSQASLPIIGCTLEYSCMPISGVPWKSHVKATFFPTRVSDVISDFRNRLSKI